MKRVLEQSIKAVAVASALLLANSQTKPVQAFGGEDPVNGNPWHHEMISKEGSQSETLGTSKWTPEAAAAIAWHADYVDSYLYNPLWWAASIPDSGIKRFKASRSVQAELEALHFDDLYSTSQVNAAWRRYASGTFAGLMWAKARGDVGAAQNVLGASLHSIQDFYSHSNWVDAKERRNISFFEMPLAKRLSTPLFTGSYEHEPHMGVKPHGKYLYAAALFKRPGVAQVMEAACSVFSPMAGSDMCEDYKASKTGVSVRPTIDTKLFGGAKLPNDVLVLAPAGIALDNTWTAAVGVKERGLTDLTGVEAFNTARALAVKQTTQWLQTMEKAMRKAGAGEFWDKMRTTPADDTTRFAQYEQFNRFPFLFLASGPYPVTSSAEEWYLRIKLTTGTDSGAGTDSDIKLRVPGQPDRVLDWMPKANPILAHNDFENGDDEIYIAGPYSTPPTQIELYNDSANTGELLGASWRALKDATETAVNVIPNIVKGILGTSADHIKTEHKVWMPEELAAVPTFAQAPGKTIKILGRTITTPAGQEFSVDLNGGDEGFYRLHGHILKSSEDAENYSFQVRLTTLECVKESKWDRSSNSDEPFLISALSPFPGDTIPSLSKVFDDVDTGETVSINTLFRPVTVPKGSGMLNLALGAFEHDDESTSTREELRDKFIGKINEETEDEKRSLVNALGAYTAADWKLQRIEVDAWSRNGVVKVGNMLKENAGVWVKGKKGVTFSLSMKDVVNTNVTTDELLPYLPPKGAPAGDTPGSTTPDTTTPDTTTPGTTTPGGTTSAADLDKWLGVWTTTKGEITVTRDGNLLRGQVRRPDPMSRIVGNAETMELRAVGDGVSLEGNWKFGTSGTTGGPIRWTWKEDLTGGEHPGMEEYSGAYSINGTTNGGPYDWNGWRTRKTSNTGTTTTPGSTVPPVGSNTGTVPPLSNANGTNSPNGNPGTVPPLTNTGSASGAGFQTLDKWQVKIDEMKLGVDGRTLEVFATFRNKHGREMGLGAGDFTLIATDADGIGFHSIGNLYKPTGEVPERFATTPIARKDGETKLRFVFDIPANVAPLQTLTFRTYNEGLSKFSLSSIQWPKAIPAFSATGLKNGGSGFQEYDDNYDVRFNGIKKSREGYEAFLTFKNTATYKALGLPGYVGSVDTADSEIIRHDGNLYRANGDRAERIAHTVWVEPGGEAHVRLKFITKSALTKFTLKDPYSDTALEWPVSP